MKMFLELLRKELILSTSNYYTDNFDFNARPKGAPLHKQVINFLKRIFYNQYVLGLLLRNDFFYKTVFLSGMYKLGIYLDGLSFLYDNLADEKSKKLLLRLMAFKILGYNKVKLPLQAPDYWNKLKTLEGIEDASKAIKLDWFPFELYFMDMNKINIKAQLYINPKTVLNTMVLKQYEYHLAGNDFINAAKGDVVIDLGGCYGDTAIYFANNVSSAGKVYVYEFIPSNLKILKQNLELNGLSQAVEIVNRPVWDSSGKKVYFKEAGGASLVSLNPIENADGETQTITIDDWAKSINLQKLDFIKADIEGAEPFALRGAVETLKKHKPKLALSIYHNMDDFTKIIKFIDDLQLGYKFYLDHFTVYTSETVLFARV